ncbi:DUF732 domain-containing protein [Mycobacterium sp. HUMS_1102779]|uniref:DUF732 domain-containing protein n=1 Tax=Mycobacterium sp. HUMS_1102779 TaxID=3383487 RepID=UPI0038997FB7
MSDTLASNRPDTTTHAIRAWQNAPDEPLLLPVGRVAELKYYVARRRGKLAAVLTFTALAAALLVLTPAPVQQATPPVGIAQAPISGPIPPPVAALPAPKPPPPPPVPAPKPVAAPPVQHRAAVPQAPPPDAHRQFTQSLQDDKAQTVGGNGLHPSQSTDVINAEAQEMCQDLANGGSAQPYIDGTLKKSPSLAPWQAALVVHQAIQAYCPQYDQ